MLLLIPQRYKFSSKSQQQEANTNSKNVVADTTKVQIFKQITTGWWYTWCLVLLLLIPQRYKFSSKSQQDCTLSPLICVVADTTKVQIFKQITTVQVVTLVNVLLLLIPQRYKFSSKSQLLNILANSVGVVADTTKVQIFKQITTLKVYPA